MTQTTANTTIRPAKPSDTGRLAHILADAFLIAPVGDWLIPDVTQRRAVYLNYFAIFVQHGLDHGIVEVTDQLTGIAIWLARNNDTPPIPDYNRRLTAACGPHTARFQVLDETFSQHHPHGTFHHHLLFLGVSPTYQGRGIGHGPTATPPRTVRPRRHPGVSGGIQNTQPQPLPAPPLPAQRRGPATRLRATVVAHVARTTHNLTIDRKHYPLPINGSSLPAGAPPPVSPLSGARPLG